MITAREHAAAAKVNGKPVVQSSKTREIALAKELRDQLLGEKLRREVGGNHNKILLGFLSP